jgi:hypothetical protein
MQYRSTEHKGKARGMSASVLASLGVSAYPRYTFNACQTGRGSGRPHLFLGEGILHFGEHCGLPDPLPVW